MSDRLPLSALLSYALVAFTIEFDNEAEHLLPHRTTRFGASEDVAAPWLTSMVMWWNCMRFVSDPPRSMAEIEHLAGTVTNWAGMERWGYVRFKVPPGDGRKRPRPADRLVHATPTGRLVQDVWEPLTTTIEARWNERFGRDAVDRLRTSLDNIASQLEPRPPDCMPILHYGLSTRRGVPDHPPQAESSDSLPALLSRLLVATSLSFETTSPVSLAISANVFRHLDEYMWPVRELPALTGISKEAIAMAIGYLEKLELARIEPGPTRGPAIRLTPAGLEAHERDRELLSAIESDWRGRHGGAAVDELYDALTSIIGDPGDLKSPFMTGFRPYPDGWRAKVKQPIVLPHYPMVLHRGGFPDGS